MSPCKSSGVGQECPTHTVSATSVTAFPCTAYSNRTKFFRLASHAMNSGILFLLWTVVALLGALALATIALHRGEQINALWLVAAAICTYALGYRFYSGF